MPQVIASGTALTLAHLPVSQLEDWHVDESVQAEPFGSSGLQTEDEEKSQYALLTHSPEALPHAAPTATRGWQDPDAQ